MKQRSLPATMRSLIRSSGTRSSAAWRPGKTGQLIRKRLSVAAVAIWLGLASAVLARAEYVCLPPRLGGGESYLLLRTGPGREYPEIGPMVNRSTVTVIGRKDDWVHVRTHAGHSGWAFEEGICPGIPGIER